MLPKIPLPTGAVDVGGQTVIIRGLSRTEYLAVGRFGRDGFEDGEALILSAGTGVTVDEAKTWLNTTDPQTAGTVLDAIVALSGGIGSDGTNPKPDTSEP
jgi:hypothetical protein